MDLSRAIPAADCRHSSSLPPIHEDSRGTVPPFAQADRAANLPAAEAWRLLSFAKNGVKTVLPPATSGAPTTTVITARDAPDLTAPEKQTIARTMRDLQLAATIALKRLKAPQWDAETRAAVAQAFALRNPLPPAERRKLISVVGDFRKSLDKTVMIKLMEPALAEKLGAEGATCIHPDGPLVEPGSSRTRYILTGKPCVTTPPFVSRALLHGDGNRFQWTTGHELFHGVGGTDPADHGEEPHAGAFDISHWEKRGEVRFIKPVTNPALLRASPDSFLFLTLFLGGVLRKPSAKATAAG